MEKNDNISLNNINHGISILERKTLNVTGVNKIESFDDEEFFMETTMGYLVVKGEGLEIVKLDTKEGVVCLKGLIISMCYVDKIKKNAKEGSIFSKMFKWVY